MKIKLFVAFALGLSYVLCTGFIEGDISQKAASVNKIEVIDFHSTHRCKTCNAIEANTRYTLEKYYAKELKSGKIVFKTINVDDDENYEVARKFGATSTALFLYTIRNGKGRKVNLTDFAFLNGNNQGKFSEGLKAQIDKQLAKL